MAAAAGEQLELVVALLQEVRARGARGARGARALALSLSLARSLDARRAPVQLFPPPPPKIFTELWERARVPMVDEAGVTRDTSLGVVEAMTQRLVNGRSLDFALRSGPMHLFQVRRAAPHSARVSL